MQALSIFQSMGDVEVQSWIYKWMTFHLGRNKLRHLRTSKAKQSQCRRVKRQNRKAKIPRVTPRRPRGSEQKAAGWFALLRSWSLGCRLPVCFPRDHGCWHCATPCSFDLLQPANLTRVENRIFYFIQCQHVHITWLGPIAQ